MIKFFKNEPEILAVMSEREDGSMKFHESSSLILKNREIFFERNGIDVKKVITAEIVHGVKIEVVDSSSPGFVLKADGLITQDENIFLSVTVADCIPVYLYESEKKIVGVIHCGWRGIVGEIIEKTIEKILSIGGKSENLKIALGPGINSCHFEIKENVLGNFGNYPEFIIKREDKIFIDLKGIIKKQLVGFGIKIENIENNNECTLENDKYFSYRRDKPKVVESMIAVVGIIN